MNTHLEMNALVLDVQLGKELGVPIRPPEPGSGITFRNELLLQSDEIDISKDETCLFQGRKAILALIEKARKAIHADSIPALTYADIAWFSSKGRYSIWMLTEPMPNVTTTHFKPVS